MREIKLWLIKLHWLLSSQFGFDPRMLLRSLRGIPTFVRDWLRFRQEYTGRLRVMPCLHDRYEEGGITKSEYFWQDLLVARQIYALRPKRHVDVGSRVDGFVAHVASFREIEVFDIRPITTMVPGVVFKQADLMNDDSISEYVKNGGYCDSLSCLHAIEHFGLGRYGDPIDTRGYQRGISNLSKFLKSDGMLYLATPIGQQRVEFNAGWVFDPRLIIECAFENDLSLDKLTVIGGGHEPRDVLPDDELLKQLAQCHYNLGVFVFRKVIAEG